MFVVYGIDPGGTTGICVAEWDRGVDSVTKKPDRVRQFNFDPHGVYGHHLQLYNHMSQMWDVVYGTIDDTVPSMDVKLHIVCEDFQQRRLDKVVLTPVEYIGVVRLFEAQRASSVRLRMQPPADKGFWDDIKLKKVGLYKASEPHQNDATRHMLLYMMKTLNNQSYLQMLRPS
jgi:hypothetical protein